LAKATGATIVFGPTAQTGFNAHIAHDGEQFQVGKIKFEVLHTPGHTMESTTYLLYDEKGKKHSIYTGDTLFIGDVGRPDLAIKSDLTKEDLASMLYDSLENKIKNLPDYIIIYPGHGAGSACGKNMSKDTFDTLGNQKKSNYALKATDKKQFIAEVLDGLTAPPAYFGKNAMLNKSGYVEVEQVINQGTQELSTQAFEDLQIETNAIILDTRDPARFKEAFIPGAINIGLDGQFAPWAGNMIPDLTYPILLITETGKEEEAVTRMARVGFENILGYLKGGFTSWLIAQKPIDKINSIAAKELKTLRYQNINIIDLRRQAEYDAGHLPEATHLSLDSIDEWSPTLDKNKVYYLHCAGGYRSVIAESILLNRGFNNLIDISGGYSAIDKELQLSTIKKEGFFNKLFSFTKFKN
jgi:rhodanese-related sulfurtransferase